MYAGLRALLFQLDPERSHTVALKSLQLADRLGLLKLLYPMKMAPKKVMGISFPNPIGLSAGLDKNADYLDALGNLGFGFIEIGTVTPKPQTGNLRPRLFRLKQEKAIINRMGFNNKGIDYVKTRLTKSKYKGILGINIGKNKDTPLEHAIDDYLQGFRAFWPFAHYITINVSSPNTPGLRDLQQSHWLKQLLSDLKKEQASIAEQHGKYVPLVVKISPDLSWQEIEDLARVFIEEKIDGIIATNTTIDRSSIPVSPYAKENGGLSGAPLFEKSTQVLQILHQLLPDTIPLIASGGIMDEKTASTKFQAGAQLLQLYTGFIYEGPELIKRLIH